MGVVRAAEISCANNGARLYQLRSTTAIDYFKNSEKFHMGQLGLFPYAPMKGHVALGMKYDTNMTGDQVSILYRQVNCWIGSDRNMVKVRCIYMFIVHM